MMYNIYNYIIKRSLLNRSAEMNIQIQTFGLLILALLYVFYKSIRTLQLYSEKIFRRTLYISIISLTLDILSIDVTGVQTCALPIFRILSSF